MSRVLRSALGFPSSTNGIGRRRKHSSPRLAAFDALEDRTLLSAFPTLDVFLNRSSVFEYSGSNAATGTVTRRGDLSQPLTVLLSSDDTTEITVPSTVTIAAGQASATFAVAALHDTLLDGTQQVTITATAAMPVDNVGRYDPAFGAGGFFETNEHMVAVLPTADGPFYTVALHYTGLQTGNIYDVFVRRFNAEGTRDDSFGTDGFVQYDLSGVSELPRAAALQSDGKLVIAGDIGGGRGFLLRLNADGTRDTTFGALDDTQAGGVRLGYVVIDSALAALSYRDVAIQADGRILVAGNHDSDMAVTRFMADGTLDATFGLGGLAITEAAHVAYGLATQADGKVVLVGTVGGGNWFSQVVLARFTDAGTLDASFGAGGTVTTDLEGEFDWGFDVAVQPDDKLVVAARTGAVGVYPPLYDFVAIRYDADGSLDPTFAGDGTVRTDLGESDQPYAVALAPDGSIILAGHSTPPDGTGFNDHTASFARYDSDGILIETVRSLVSGREVEDIAVLPDGTLLLAGAGLGLHTGMISRYEVFTGPTVDVSDTTTISVRDYETVLLDIPSNGPELKLGQSRILTVTRSNTDVGSPLTVQIICEDPSELLVPATVIIPAGQQSATFIVQAVDNGKPDGTRDVRITLRATNYTGSSYDFSIREEGTKTLDVIADGTARDSNADGVFTVLDTTSTSIVLRDLSQVVRGIFEFQVSSFAGRTVEAAALTFTPNLAQYTTGQVFDLTVYAYAGDGVVSLADATRTATPVGTLSISSLEDFVLARRTILLDVPAIQTLVDAGGYVGLAVAMTSGQRFAVYSSEDSFTEPYEQPQLNFFLENHAPTFSAPDYVFSVVENSPFATPVGTVSATDPDAGDSLRYSIVAGNSSGAFGIHSLTGLISVVNRSQLDYETTPRFTLAVRATDDGRGLLSDESIVVIDLIDVPAPQVTDVSFGYGIDRWASAGDLADRNSPWRITKVRFTFDQNVTVDVNDLTVTGTIGGNHTFSAFAYDPATFTAIWTFTTPIDRDRLSIVLDGDPVSQSNQDPNARNDGVHTAGEYLSGGDHSLALDVLFGDESDDGEVTLLDAIMLRGRMATSDRWFDLDGDGDVDLMDAILLRGRNGTSLP